MFRFFLDDIQVPDPINWKDFTETLEHDDIIKGVLPKYEVRLDFSGGGYKYIYEQMQSFGYCKTISLRIEYKCSQSGNYKTELNGTLFIKDAKFSLNHCVASCEIEDNNYGARIYNNKSIKVFVDSALTKNGLVLTPAFNHVVTFFRPVDGVYIIDHPRKTFPIYDCFRFIIEFITDKNVGFESEYLQTGEAAEIDITTGGLIRKYDDMVMPPEVPQISFETLFSEVNKKFPIAFTVVDRGGKPTIKIENEDFFYTSNFSGVHLRSIADLKQFFNNEVLYSSVKFGGPAAPVNLAIHHFTFDKFRSFKEEEYFFTGECNIDKVLDLYGNWISDSNIIEEIFTTDTSNDSYDQNIFFIQQVLQNARQEPNPLTSADPYYYNPALTNDRVSYRHKAIELYLQDDFLGFRAALNFDQGGGIGYLPPPIGATASSGNIQIQFNVDSPLPNYDTTNNYNTSLWRYTAASSGSYTFETGISFTKRGQDDDYSDQFLAFHIVFIRRNSGGGFIEQQDINLGTFEDDGTFTVKASATFIMAVGDFLTESYYFIYSRKSLLSLPFSFAINHGSWIRNISSPTAAVRPTYGINTPYAASTLEFEYPISKEQWDLIKLDLSKSVYVDNGDGRTRECWIRKIDRVNSTSMAKCELITDIKII